MGLLVWTICASLLGTGPSAFGEKRRSKTDEKRTDVPFRALVNAALAYLPRSVRGRAKPKEITERTKTRNLNMLKTIRVFDELADVVVNMKGHKFIVWGGDPARAKFTAMHNRLLSVFDTATALNESHAQPFLHALVDMISSDLATAVRDGSITNAEIMRLGIVAGGRLGRRLNPDKVWASDYEIAAASIATEMLQSKNLWAVVVKVRGDTDQFVAVRATVAKDRQPSKIHPSVSKVVGKNGILLLKNILPAARSKINSSRMNTVTVAGLEDAFGLVDEAMTKVSLLTRRVLEDHAKNLLRRRESQYRRRFSKNPPRGMTFFRR